MPSDHQRFDASVVPLQPDRLDIGRDATFQRPQAEHAGTRKGFGHHSLQRFTGPVHQSRPQSGSTGARQWSKMSAVSMFRTAPRLASFSYRNARRWAGLRASTWIR